MTTLILATAASGDTGVAAVGIGSLLLGIVLIMLAFYWLLFPWIMCKKCNRMIAELQRLNKAVAARPN
jgi:hypothetical protein